MDVISPSNLPWVPITCLYLGHLCLNLCGKIEKGKMLSCQTTDRTSVGALVLECVGFYKNVFETLCDFYSPKLIAPQYSEISWFTQHWSEGFPKEPECGMCMYMCICIYTRSHENLPHQEVFSPGLMNENCPTLKVSLGFYVLIIPCCQWYSGGYNAVESSE